MAKRHVSAERGTSLIELMIALAVLSLGVLAVGQLFPAGSRGALSDRMLSQANMYAHQKLEDLRDLNWSNSELSAGRHPASGEESLGASGRWQLHYDVSQLAAPMDNVKRITVTVGWTFLGSRSVGATTYVRR